MSKEYIVREALESDAARLSEIYSYYVTDTAVSFEYEAPSVEEFERRIKSIKRKYPYLVCMRDDKAVGYVYAGTYSTRKAYDWTVTTSIYVDRDCRRQGVGALLYDSLEEELRKRGIVNLLAGVAYCEREDEYLSDDSKDFHVRMGYSQVAHMKSVGKKFDRWYDLLWFQKNISGSGGMI